MHNFFPYSTNGLFTTIISVASLIVCMTLQEENKIKVGQLNNELSEMSSQLMVKEKELTKLKEDNKLLVKQFRDRKEKKRRETIPQVCYS